MKRRKVSLDGRATPSRRAGTTQPPIGRLMGTAKVELLAFTAFPRALAPSLEHESLRAGLSGAPGRLRRERLRVQCDEVNRAAVIPGRERLRVERHEVDPPSSH